LLEHPFIVLDSQPEVKPALPSWGSNGSQLRCLALATLDGNH
jgi:hypothetical protein